MKLLALNCNTCGAPLEVPDKVKHVTCTYCNSRLRVTHEGPAAYTEALDAIAEDVRELKHHAELESLDRRWAHRREELLIRGKDGSTHVPTRGVVLGGTIFAVVAGVLWMTFAASMGAPVVFTLFGLVFIGAAVFGGVSALRRAEAYEREHADYERDRHELLGRLEGEG